MVASNPAMEAIFHHVRVRRLTETNWQPQKWFEAADDVQRKNREWEKNLCSLCEDEDSAVSLNQ